MTRTRYNSGIGSKLLIGAVLLILLAAVSAMIFAFAKNEQFNSFKRELSSLSGGVKSELYTEYKGNIYEITKKDFSHIYTFLTSSTRQDSQSGADITDSFSIHLKNMNKEGVLSINETDTEYIIVSFNTQNSEYTYWFKSVVGYGSLLKLSGAPAK